MRSSIFIVLLACISCATSLQSPLGQIVPADLTHGPILVRLSVGDSAPVWALFDTGAQAAVLTADYARANHLPDQGPDEVVSPLGGEPIHGFHTTVPHARIGEVVASQFTATAAPLDMGAPRAILGPDVFAGRLVTIDIANSRLLISPRGREAPAGVESGYGRDTLPTIAVSAGGRNYLAHLDTGSDSPLSMNLSLARDLPLAAAPRKTAQGQSVNTTFDIYSAQLLGDMHIGPLTLHNPTIEFFDTPGAGVNIGRGMLAQMLITLDPERRSVWSSTR
jgi:hypothetical protein